MKKAELYTSWEMLPVVLNANDIAIVLNISRAKSYELLHSAGFPVIKIGKRRVVPKDRFMEWIAQQTT